MLSRRSILLPLAVATLSGGSLPVLAGSRRIDPIRMFDTDNDGTLDLAEGGVSHVREAGPRS
jgi:hypothetical protein